jgi:hypothetical protein
MVQWWWDNHLLIMFHEHFGVNQIIIAGITIATAIHHDQISGRNGL